MIRSKAAALVTFLGFTLTSPAYAQKPEAGRPNAQAGQSQKATAASARQITAPEMQFTTRNEQQIAGVLSQPSMRIAFAARMANPSRAVLRLELGDIGLDAEADFEKDTRTLDGHGHALSVDERMALLDLHAELSRNLNPFNRQLLEHEDLLRRVVAYWADAPVGWPLKRRVTFLPRARKDQ